MRETGATDEGHACEVVVAGGDGKAAAARRRRRLELRRLGLAAEDDAAAKRIRSVKDGSSSDDSSTEVVPRSWPACVSHGSVSVIGRRREMEDAVAIERTFMASTGDGAGAIRGGGEGEEDFFAVYDGHGGSRVAEACRKRMHVVLAEEVSLRRLRGQSASGGDVRWKEAMLASFARMDGEVVGSVAAAAPRVDGTEPSGFRTVGSTAVVAVVGRRRIVVANCGDSRAVLSRGGVALPLSTDHKVRYVALRKIGRAHV